MTPLSQDEPVPAGDSTLHNIRNTISYEDVVVTTDYLREMNVKLAEAPDKAKYAIYRARLYYGNLRRWQKQGLHFLYESYQNSKHCTCGLVLDVNGDSDQESAVFLTEEIQSNFRVLDLDDVQRVRGHVGLPALRGRTNAIIVDCIYQESLAEYMWTVICQECGVYEVNISNSQAKNFVRVHNKVCGFGTNKKKGK
jgi:hypothetical protein